MEHKLFLRHDKMIRLRSVNSSKEDVLLIYPDITLAAESCDFMNLFINMGTVVTEIATITQFGNTVCLFCNY